MCLFPSSLSLEKDLVAGGWVEGSTHCPACGVPVAGLLVHWAGYHGALNRIIRRVQVQELGPLMSFFLNWGIWNASIIIEVRWGPMSVIRCFLHPYLWWLKKLLKSVNIQCINTQQAVLLFFCFCAGAHAERQPPGGGVVGQQGSQAHHSYQEERGDSREVSRAPTTPQNVRLSTFVVPFYFLPVLWVQIHWI